jgi:excisionase family DNA binding protein
MKLLYKSSEAKAALGVGNTTFYRLINDGSLDARRFGRRTYITAESLEALVDSLKPVVTPTMANAQSEASQNPRDRFTSLARRPPAAE